MRYVRSEDRNSLKKYFNFIFHFRKHKTFYLKNYYEITQMVQLLIAAEMEKPEPFKEIIDVGRFKPQKHFKVATTEDDIKVLRLCQLIVGQKLTPLHHIWVFKYMVGYKTKDKEIIENSVQNLIDSTQISVYEQESRNERIELAFNIRNRLVRERFSSKKNPTSDWDIKVLKENKKNVIK